MDEYHTSVELFASVNRALLGAVDRRMVAVTAGFRGQTIHLRSYVEDAVRPDDVERIQVIGTEVIAGFVDNYFIEEECLSIKDHPLQVLAFWAFMRAQDE